MTIIVETGSRVDGANSYVTVAEFNAYLALRYPSRSAPTEAVAEGYLLRAMDYLESLDFIGGKATDAQPLQWPRDRVRIDGYAITSSEIPKELKVAQYEAAYGYELGYGKADPIERTVQSEKIGEIAITYANNSSSRVETPAVNMALKKLLKSTAGTGIIRA